MLLSSVLFVASLCPAAAPARIAPARAVNAALATAPAAWRTPVAAYLGGTLDTAGLRAQLLAPVVAPADASASAVPAAFSALAVSSVEDDRVEAARRLYGLDAVLAGFLSVPERAPLTSAAARAREALSDARRAEVLEWAMSVSDALDDARRREDGVATPAGREGFTGGSLVADLLEIELPYLREGEARLRLDAAGAVAFDAEGFPESESYFLAAKAAALLRDGAAAALPPADRALLVRLAAVHARTADVLFGDEDTSARKARYAEPTPGGAEMTVLDFVRSERFKTPGRWVWSSQRSREAPKGFAAVTGETARSPFVGHLGPGAFTTIYWAALPGGEFGRPDPLGMRVRANSDGTGRERGMEVLVPIGVDADGELRWKGYLFTRVGHEWVPGSPRRVESTRRCVTCHFRVDARGDRRLTPLPLQLRSKADFLGVGYQDTALVADYLRLVERYASAR